jgi:HlyD family secretion protein
MIRRLLLLACLAVPSAYAADTAPAPGNTALPAITVVTAVQREMVETVVVTGTLVAREEIMVGAEIDGLRLTEVLAEEGDMVAKGQVLARFGRDTIEAQLAQNSAAMERLDAAIAQARSRIAEAEANRREKSSALERSQSLQRSGVASEAALEQRAAAAQAADAQAAAARDGLRLAEAQRAEAMAQRRELTVQLGRSEIKAPNAGLVTRRTARVGAIVMRSGDALFRLAGEGRIELEADVPETTLARLRAGQPAALLALGEGPQIDARVRLVSPEVNRASRLGRVRIAPEQIAPLTLGSFGRATIELARRDAIAVPLSAVQFGPAGPQVQVVKDNVVESRTIAIGLKSGKDVEAASGLRAGEQVVAIAGTFLRNGDRVRPQQAGGRAP